MLLGHDDGSTQYRLWQGLALHGVVVKEQLVASLTACPVLRPLRVSEGGAARKRQVIIAAYVARAEAVRSRRRRWPGLRLHGGRELTTTGPAALVQEAGAPPRCRPGMPARTLRASSMHLFTFSRMKSADDAAVFG